MLNNTDIRTYTVWSSDCLRTLEFTSLSLGLLFECICPSEVLVAYFVDDGIIDREALATVINLL
ncbi:hypothetical protein [Natrinema salaciae]|uniref:hypothetical protein n=1 Tax=Natrinema salaciae TaxID=1186196 RepID=UPI0015871FDA